MNPELFTLHRLTAGMLYPPFGLQPVDVNRIYAAITERYPYQSLQHLPDGARMANAENDCFIQQTRIQINETVQLHFEATKQKCVDMFSVIQNHLHIPQFMTFGIKLTSLLPMEQTTNAARFVENNMLPEVTRRLDMLGEGREGVGLRLIMHREAVYELKIEPFFGDLSQLYVELDVQHTNPFADLAMVPTWMDSAYNYLFGEVKNFIGSFA